MNKDQALEVLEKALNIANKAGAFNLADAATVQVAINTVKQFILTNPSQEDVVESKPEVKSKK